MNFHTQLHFSNTGKIQNKQRTGFNHNVSTQEARFGWFLPQGLGQGYEVAVDIIFVVVADHSSTSLPYSI